MKIALVHYRLARAGGLERRLMAYASGFLEMGHEVDIVYAKRKPGVRLDDRVRLKKIPVFSLRSHGKMAQFAYGSARWLNRNQYDLTISLGRTPGADGLLCPGTHSGYKKAMDTPWKKKDFVLDRLDRQAYAGSKIILAASEMMKQELETYYRVPSSKIRILYPPLDTALFRSGLKAKQKELKAKLGMEQGKYSFLFVSYSHDRKGLPLLLRLFESLGNEPVELIILGVEPGIPLPANVKYAGYSLKMDEYYAAADFLIHPALYEPFGQIVSESLQMQTPVIVSEKTGAAELLTEEEGMVVKGFNLHHWEETVRKAIKRKWEIRPDFARRKGFDRNQHLARMLEFLKAIPPDPF